MYSEIASVEFYLITAFLNYTLAVIIWQNRKLPGSSGLAIGLAGLAWWLVTFVVGSQATTETSQLMWIKLHYLATFPIPLALIHAALQLTGRSSQATWKLMAALSFPAVVAFALLWFNEYHFLFWSSVEMEGRALHVTNGIVFYLIHSYGHAIMLVTIVLFFHRISTTSGLARRQLCAILLGAVIAITGNFLWMNGISTVGGLDILPLSFALTGVIISWALLFLRAFDIIPLAQSAVIEDMGDGLVVLGNDGRIVAVNQAAQSMLSLPNTSFVGKPFQELFQDWPDLVNYIHGGSEQSTVCSQGRYFLAYTKPVPARGRPLGKALVLRDVTAQKMDQEKMLEQERALAVLKERDWMSKELHDNQGQFVGFTKAQSQAIYRLLKDGKTDQALTNLEYIISAADQVYSDIRVSVNGLRAASESWNLQLYLNSFVLWFAESTQIRVSLHGLAALSPGLLSIETEIQLFRIIQESLANARKHADCDQIIIDVTLKTAHVEIIIQDNGRGFSPEHVKEESQGFGLGIIQERAAAVEGTCLIQSAVNQGTKITIELPLVAQPTTKPALE